MNIDSSYCRAQSVRTGVKIHGYYCGSIPESGEHVLWTRKYGDRNTHFCHKQIKISTIEFRCPIKDIEGKPMYENDEVELSGIRYILMYDKKTLRWCMSLGGIPAIYLHHDTKVKLIDYYERRRN